MSALRPLLRVQQERLKAHLTTGCRALLKGCGVQLNPSSEALAVCTAVEELGSTPARSQPHVQALLEFVETGTHPGDDRLPDNVLTHLFNGAMVKLFSYLMDNITVIAFDDATLHSIIELFFDVLDSETTGSIAWKDAHELRRLFGPAGSGACTPLPVSPKVLFTTASLTKVTISIESPLNQVDPLGTSGFRVSLASLIQTLMATFHLPTWPLRWSVWLRSSCAPSHCFVMASSSLCVRMRWR